MLQGEFFKIISSESIPDAGPNTGTENFRVVVNLDPLHPIYEGHFPQNPVVPGVCQIQCALAAVEKAKNKSAQLREIVLAKYYSPVGPGEEIVCTCNDVAEDGEFTFKSVLTKGQAKVAELKLKVTMSGEYRGH